MFVILVQFAVYNYPYILKIEPRFIHSWRQYDCLAFAKAFQNNRAGLWEPRLSNLGGNNSGKAASEFPIVPMMVGKTWQLTGENVAIYRMVNLLLLAIALYFVYLLFLEESGSKVVSALIAALIFTSPNLSYYGISVLSDIQAFSLSLIAFYYVVQWLKSFHQKHLVIFTSLFILAGLIKASFILIYLLAVFYLIIEASSSKALTKRTLLRQLALITVIPMVTWAIWITHVSHYNSENNPTFFLIGILPIWDMDMQAILGNSKRLWRDLLPQVYNSYIISGLLLLLIYTAVKNFKRALKHSVVLLSLFSLIGGYILLFYGAFDVHDYYLIVVGALIIICVFFLFKTYKEIILQEKWRCKLVALLALLVMYNSFASSIKTWSKTNMNVTNIENKMFLNEFEQKNYFWMYWWDRKRYEPIEKFRDEIKKIIPVKDTILCLGDETINRSLVLLDRVGYTEFNCKLNDLSGFIKTHPNISYLIMLDEAYTAHPHVDPYRDKKVYENLPVTIYRVK